MIREPQLGDVLLRGDIVNGFQIVDVVSRRVLGGMIPTIEAAVEAARRRGAPAIWQQPVDNRGRLLGEPFRFLRPPRE